MEYGCPVAEQLSVFTSVKEPHNRRRRDVNTVVYDVIARHRGSLG